MSFPYWPIDATDFWTLVTGVATGVLASAALLALRQLSLGRDQLRVMAKQLESAHVDTQLAKKDILNRAERDAIVTAIQLCDDFRREIIPLNGYVITQMNMLKIPVFVQSASEVQFDPDNKGEVRRAEEWLARLPGELQNHSISMINKMEVWSMYFTHGVADSSVAFEPVAPMLVGLVVQLYALILVKRHDNESGLFPNLVQLFKIWTGHPVPREDEAAKAARGVAIPAALRQVIQFQQEKAPVGYVAHPKVKGTDLDGTTPRG